MTIPGQYILQNFENGLVGQAVYGPPNISGGTFGATTNVNVPAAQVQEVAMAGPLPPSLTAVPVGTPVATWFGAAAGVAQIIPYARVSAPGVVTLATGNLSGAPASFGPLAPNVAGYRGIMRHQLLLSSAVLAGSATLQAFPSPGVVAARQGVESSIAAICNDASLIVANPTAALPAGFMCGYVRPGAFTANIMLSNLTAGGLNPGITNWNLHALTFDLTVADEIPSGQNGPVAISIVSGVTVTFGAIAAASVLEATAAVPGLDPGDGIIVCPRSALPDVNMAPSHSRCAVANTLIWGMANLDAAVATAGADIVCDVAILKPLPIF